MNILDILLYSLFKRILLKVCMILSDLNYPIGYFLLKDFSFISLPTDFQEYRLSAF